jgi:hypothetical protein
MIRPVAPVPRLCAVLLGYLEDPQVTIWPGADGLTVGDLLRNYPEAVAAGQAPGRAELQLRHPDLAAEVVAFFAA